MGQLRANICLLRLRSLALRLHLPGRNPGALEARLGLVLLLPGKMFFGRFLVELGSFPLLDSNGILRAVPQTRPETVTVDLAYQLRLAVNYLDGAFGTGSDALTASIALVFVNYDDISQNHVQVSNIVSR
jgi:hypothetical protein